MKQLPKIKDFKAPEGYFEHLPDQIMARRSSRPVIPIWSRYAAAAMVILSIGIWVLTQPEATTDPYLALDSEVNLYIESQYWTAEDILSLTDDSGIILEEIIEEETVFGNEQWIDEPLF